MQELTGGHTPPPHSFFPEAVPGLFPTLPYLPSAPYQTEPFQPNFMYTVPPAVTMTPQTDDFVGQIPIPVPIPSSPTANAVVHSPRPQLTPKHSFTRDPVLGSLIISKSERVEELEKMADEVAKRNRDLSGDLPKAAVAAAIGELNEKISGDHLNLNKTLLGPPVPSGEFGGKRMGWDNDVIGKREAESYDVGEPQQREGRSRDLMSVFPADHQAVQSHHPREQPPHVGGFTYQTPPTPTLMAVLGPPKQTLASESGLDALERRLLAEVGTRKHLEPWDNNTHHDHTITEEDEENVENGKCGIKTKVFKDHQLGRRDVRDVLLSPSSPAVAGAAEVVNGNQRLPPINTDLDLDLAGREGVDSGGSGGGNGVSAPIAIPMKSPDPLNESCISSLTLGGEGLASGLPNNAGPSNGGGPAPAAGDSDGEGDGEAEFDGRTHRAGSASISGGSNSSSDRMMPGARGGGGGDDGGFHRHTRQRAEVSTPTEMIPQQRVKSRRGGSGRGSGGSGRVETKERVKTSSSKKKERLTATGKGTSEPKKSRNKSSAAAKGRVAAWLGGIDSAVPPQEEIIPPSPSVVRDLDSLSFEEEQRAAVGSLARSPLAVAVPLLPLHPDSDSQTTPGGALALNARSDVAAANGGDNENNMDQDEVISASPNPRSSGFVPITTLKRNTISLPSVGSVRRPLLLSRDATAIEETRRVQDLWSSTPPGITSLDKDTLKPGGAMSLLAHEKILRKPSPSSSSSKPASMIPLSYSAAVTSAPPSAPPSAPSSSSGAIVTPRNIWKNTDHTQSTSQPKGRQVPPTTKPPGYKPPSGNLPMFHPSKPPIDPEVEYDIRSARGGRGGKVSSVASLWASGAINNQRHNHQTAATTAAAAASHSNVEDKVKDVPKRLFNTVEDTLPSSSALSKPVKTKKKLFSAAVMTPAPALKNVRTYTSPPVASGSGGGGGSSSAPKKMASTPALLVRSVDVLGEKAAAGRSIDNVLVERPTPNTATTKTTMMNVFQGGNKTTPSANLSTSSSGPPGGKLHELTTTKRAAVNGPPGVMIKATSDPAVISSSHAVPTLSSTASLVRPHDRNSTGGKQDYYRHLQPRVAVVKLPSTTPGSGSISGSTVSPRLGSPQVAMVDDDTNSNPRKPAELAFGQARLRDLIKKYQGSSPG